MNPYRTAKNVACLVLMTLVGTVLLYRWGWSLRTAVVIALVLSRPVAMLYAWYVSRRAEAATRTAVEALQPAAGRCP